MLLLLLAGCYALFIPLGFGTWFERGINLAFGLRNQEPLAWLTRWLGGILLLTVGLEAWSLLGPVHTLAHLAALAIGGAGLALPAGRQQLRQLASHLRQLPALVVGLGGVLVLCALVVSTMPPINIDTGYYHAQSVRWLEEMGVVPGLANIELHIGFNSAWFVPEALFDWGRYVGSPLQALNLVFFVLFGWYGLGGLAALLRGRAAPADVLRLVLAVCMAFWVIDDLASLSPDPAVTLLVFYVLVQAVALPAPQPGQPLRAAHVALLLLSVFALTVKLSTLPLLLLPLWWVGRSGRLLNGRFLLAAGGLSVAIVAPWLARNYVISGYLVFPVASIDLFNPSWKFPLAELRLHNDYIKEYARNTDFYNQISVHDKPWQFWLPLWWRQQYRPNQVLLLALPALGLLSAPLAWWQYRRGQLPQAPRLLVAGLVALAGVAFWFALAPAFRFGYGFLLSLLGLLGLPWLGGAARYLGSRQLALGLGAALGGLLLLGPLAVEYRHYVIARAIGRLEYAGLLAQLPTAADQAFVRAQFPQATYKVRWGKRSRSLAERARLVWLISHAGGVGVYTGLDGQTGRSGLVGLGGRLVRPAPYPLTPVRLLPLPPAQVLESPRNQVPWYAPFPFVARRRQCIARGPALADGFRAKVVPIRDWRREARW